MMFSALLIAAGYSQSVKMTYSNEDCTGDIILAVGSVDPCPSTANGQCILGSTEKCSQGTPDDSISVPDKSLPYLVGNNYSGEGCTSGFFAQTTSLADGKCHKIGPAYTKVTCDGTQAISSTCTDAECTQCTSATDAVGTCLTKDGPAGQKAFQKFTCVLAGAGGSIDGTAPTGPSVTTVPATASATKAAVTTTKPATTATTTKKSDANNNGFVAVSIASLILLNL